MLSNQMMNEGRFARWARYRRLERKIRAHLTAGRTVIASTYLKHTKLTAKNDGGLKADRNGLLIRSGRSWVDITYCKFTVY